MSPGNRKGGVLEVAGDGWGEICSKRLKTMGDRGRTQQKGYTHICDSAFELKSAIQMLL